MTSNKKREGDNGSIVTPSTPGVFYRPREYPHPDDRHSVSSYCVQDGESQNNNGRKAAPCRTIFGTLLLIGLFIVAAIVVAVTTILTQPQDSNMQQTVAQTQNFDTKLQTEPILERKPEKLRPDLIEKLRKEICNVMKDLFDFDEGFSKTSLRNCSVSLAKRFGSSGNLYVNMVLKPDQALFDKQDGELENELFKNVNAKVNVNIDKIKTTLIEPSKRQTYTRNRVSSTTTLQRQDELTSSEAKATTTVPYFKSDVKSVDYPSAKVSSSLLADKHLLINPSSSILLNNLYDSDRKTSHATERIDQSLYYYSSKIQKIRQSEIFKDNSLLYSSESDISKYVSPSSETGSQLDTTPYIRPSRVHFRQRIDTLHKDQRKDNTAHVQSLVKATESFKSETNLFTKIDTVSSKFDFKNESMSIIRPVVVDYTADKSFLVPVLSLDHPMVTGTGFDSSFVTRAMQQTNSYTTENSFHVTSSLLALEHAMSESQHESQDSFSVIDNLTGHGNSHMVTELYPSTVLDTTIRPSKNEFYLMPSMNMFSSSDIKSQILTSVMSKSEMTLDISANLQSSINSNIGNITKVSVNSRETNIHRSSETQLISSTDNSVFSKNVTPSVSDSVKDAENPPLLMTKFVTFPTEFTDEPLPINKHTMEPFNTILMQPSSTRDLLSTNSLTPIENAQTTHLPKTKSLQFDAEGYLSSVRSSFSSVYTESSSTHTQMVTVSSLSTNGYIKSLDKTSADMSDKGSISNMVTSSTDLKKIIPTSVLESSQVKSDAMSIKLYTHSRILTHNTKDLVISDSEIQPSMISSFGNTKEASLVDSTGISTSLRSTLLFDVTTSSYSDDINEGSDKTLNLQNEEASSSLSTASSEGLFSSVHKNVFLHKSTIEPSFPIIKTTNLLDNGFVTSLLIVKTLERSIDSSRSDSDESPTKKNGEVTATKAKTIDGAFTTSSNATGMSVTKSIKSSSIISKDVSLSSFATTEVNIRASTTIALEDDIESTTQTNTKNLYIEPSKSAVTHHVSIEPLTTSSSPTSKTSIISSALVDKLNTTVPNPPIGMGINATIKLENVNITSTIDAVNASLIKTLNLSMKTKPLELDHNTSFQNTTTNSTDDDTRSENYTDSRLVSTMISDGLSIGNLSIDAAESITISNVSRRFEKDSRTFGTSVLSTKKNAFKKNVTQLETELAQTSTVSYFNKSSVAIGQTENNAHNLAETTESFEISDNADHLMVGLNKTINISSELSLSNTTPKEILESTTSSNFENNTNDHILKTSLSFENQTHNDFSDILIANSTNNKKAETMNTTQDGLKESPTNATNQDKINRLQTSNNVFMSNVSTTPSLSVTNKSVVEEKTFNETMTVPASTAPVTSNKITYSTTSELISLSQNKSMKSMELINIKSNFTSVNVTSDSTTTVSVQNPTQRNLMASVTTNAPSRLNETESNNMFSSVALATSNTTKDTNNPFGFHIEFNGEKMLSAFDLSSANNSTGNASTAIVNEVNETSPILTYIIDTYSSNNKSSYTTSSHTSTEDLKEISSTTKSTASIQEKYVSDSTQNLQVTDTTTKTKNESSYDLQDRASTTFTVIKSSLDPQEMTTSPTDKITDLDHSSKIKTVNDTMTSPKPASSIADQIIRNVTSTISPKDQNLKEHEQGYGSKTKTTENLEESVRKINLTSELSTKPSKLMSSLPPALISLSTVTSTTTLSDQRTKTTENLEESVRKINLTSELSTKPSKLMSSLPPALISLSTVTSTTTLSDQRTNRSTVLGSINTKNVISSAAPHSPPQKSSTSTTVQQSMQAITTLAPPTLDTISIQATPSSLSPALSSTTQQLLDPSSSSSSIPVTPTNKVKPISTPRKSMTMTTMLSETTSTSKFATTTSPAIKLSTQSLRKTISSSPPLSSSPSDSEGSSTESSYKTNASMTTTMQMDINNSSILKTTPSLTKVEKSNIAEVSTRQDGNKNDSKFIVPLTTTTKQEITTESSLTTLEISNIAEASTRQDENKNKNDSKFVVPMTTTPKPDIATKSSLTTLEISNIAETSTRQDKNKNDSKFVPMTTTPKQEITESSLTTTEISNAAETSIRQDENKNDSKFVVPMTTTPKQEVTTESSLTTVEISNAAETSTRQDENKNDSKFVVPMTTTSKQEITTESSQTAVEISNIAETSTRQDENKNHTKSIVAMTTTPKQEISTESSLTTVEISNIAETTTQDENKNNSNGSNTNKSDGFTTATDAVAMTTNGGPASTTTTITTTQYGNVGSFTLYPGGEFRNTAESNTGAGIGFMPLNNRIPGMPSAFSNNLKNTNDNSATSEQNNIDESRDTTTPLEELVTPKELSQWLKNIPDKRNDFKF